ncbi:hypothetical protein FQN55_001458 [Onygenales sp. PD_40]|nr:hypothetical protein FQN55_001458 [Onygenales sp. PD_40]
MPTKSNTAGLLAVVLSLFLLARGTSAQSFPTIVFGMATTCEDNGYKYDWYVWLEDRDVCMDWRDLGPTELRSPCGSTFGWVQEGEPGHFVFTDCTGEAGQDNRPGSVTWVDEGLTAACVSTQQPEKSCDAPWCGQGEGQVVNVTALQVCAG